MMSLPGKETLLASKNHIRAASMFKINLWATSVCHGGSLQQQAPPRLSNHAVRLCPWYPIGLELFKWPLSVRPSHPDSTGNNQTALKAAVFNQRCCIPLEKESRVRALLCFDVIRLNAVCVCACVVGDSWEKLWAAPRPGFSPHVTKEKVLGWEERLQEEEKIFGFWFVI